MTNFTQKTSPITLIKNILSKWYVLLVMFVIIVYVVVIVLQLLTPAPQSIEGNITASNADGSTTNFGTVSYVGEEPNFPTELPLAQIDERVLSGIEIERKLASFFNVTQDDEFPSMWFGSQYTMSFDAKKNTYTVVSNTQQRYFTKTVNVDEAIVVAETMLKQLLGNTPLEVFKQGVLYSGPHFEEDPRSPGTSSRRATTVFIPFSFAIEGVPVFFSRDFRHPFEVVVNSYGDVNKIIISAPITTIKNIRSAPLISIRQAIFNIEQNTASIISVQQQGVISSLAVLNNVLLRQVQLEYRLDPESGGIYPYYRFLGVAQDEGGTTIQIEVITPAVSTF